MGQRKSYWTYIMASQSRVLYVGVTNDLSRRVAEHKTGEGGQFTRRYRCHKLVHAEEHYDVRDAIQREKSIKGWRRQRKVTLIEQGNSAWTDISAVGGGGAD